MSVHQNPDGSVTEGVKIEPPGAFVSHSFIAVDTTAVPIGSAVAAAQAAGATQAKLQAQGADMRFRLDGTPPTTTIGFLRPNGTEFTINMTDAAEALFVSSAAATLAVTFTK